MPAPYETYVAWGNPRQGRHVVAYRKTLDASEVSLTANGTFATVDIGPAPVAGPVIHLDLTDPATAIVVLLADDQVPGWITEEFLADWGWAPALALPGDARARIETDVLLLSYGAADEFDGWSSSLWLAEEMLPLQRTHLPFPDLPGGLGVHVLEAGSDMHGVNYLVVFCPQRSQAVAANLAAHGWRREPGVRVRRQDWVNLANLSMDAELLVESMSYGPLVVGAMLHNPVDLASSAVSQLPENLRAHLTSRVTSDLPTDYP
jgi:hypothetical protein